MNTTLVNMFNTIVGGASLILVGCATVDKELKPAAITQASQATYVPSKGLSVNSEYIYFNGKIDGGICNKFTSLINSETKKLVIVNSGGGDVVEAECMARAMIQNKMDIEVRGICASSCANFLFLAGRIKYIKEGALVGYHGSLEALINEVSNGDLRKFAVHSRLRGLSKNEKRKAVASKQWNEIIKADIAGITTLLKIESQFFSDVGVNKAIFEISNRDDKGAGDNKPRGLLIPSPEAFESFGIRNLVGKNPTELEGHETFYYMDKF